MVGNWDGSDFPKKYKHSKKQAIILTFLKICIILYSSFYIGGTI